jgi:transcriptional regulator with XRE-family HTH domain
MNEFVEALKQKREEYNLTLEETTSMLNLKHRPLLSMYLNGTRELYEYKYELFLDNLETLINTEKTLQYLIKPQQ